MGNALKKLTHSFIYSFLVVISSSRCPMVHITVDISTYKSAFYGFVKDGPCEHTVEPVQFSACVRVSRDNAERSCMTVYDLAEIESELVLPGMLLKTQSLHCLDEGWGHFWFLFLCSFVCDMK